MDDASRGHLSTSCRVAIFAAVALLCALPQILAWLGVDISARGVDDAIADSTNVQESVGAHRLHELVLGVTLYSALEWTVVCLTFATAALAAARSRFHPDAVAAMITVVALWASFISGFHLLAFHGLAQQVASPPEFLFFNWAISQTFTGAIFVLASLWAIFVGPRTMRSPAGRRRLVLVAVALVFGVLAYGSVALTARATSLPLELSPEELISRPLDLPALVIFASLLLFLFPLVDRLYKSVFSFALWLSALPLVASQLYAALASEALFDAGFMASQLTRTGAYTIIFLGLVWHYHQLCIEEISLRHEVGDREMRTRLLINNAAEAIIVFDAHTHIKQWNPRAAHLFGLSRSEALGHPLLECVQIEGEPTDLAGRLERLVRDPDANLSRRIYQARARGPHHETWIPIEYTLVGAQTRPEPIFAVLARDVSEIKAMQQRIAQVDRLAAVGTLAAGVAHEINNPLSYTSSNIAFALEAVEELQAPEDGEDVEGSRRAERSNGSGPDHGAEHARGSGANGSGANGSGANGSGANGSGTDYRAELLDEIRTSLEAAQSGCDRVAHIVRDMLSISHRTDAPPTEAVDPLEAVESALRLTRAHMNHRITLSTDFKPTPEVIADPSRLTQIVVNLLINALHALEDLPAERRNICLRLFPRGHQVIIEVEDEGLGVPDDLRERIFDPFFTTKAVGQGTGLGLSLSRAIAHELKGQLRLCPSEQGARFQLSLPAHRPEDRVAAPPAAHP